jgi:hypothetical protein
MARQPAHAKKADGFKDSYAGALVVIQFVVAASKRRN